MTTTKDEAYATLRAAVKKLLECKGRFHTEQNYSDLFKAYAATSHIAPDAAAIQADLRKLLPLPDPCEIRRSYWTFASEQMEGMRKRAYELGCQHGAACPVAPDAEVSPVDTPEFSAVLVECHHNVMRADKWGPLKEYIKNLLACNATTGATK